MSLEDSSSLLIQRLELQTFCFCRGLRANPDIHSGGLGGCLQAQGRACPCRYSAGRGEVKEEGNGQERRGGCQLQEEARTTERL